MKSNMMDTWLDISNSSLHMTNCKISGNSRAIAATVITSVFSQIYMKNVQIAHVYAQFGLIHINNSELRLQHVSLSGNGLGTSISAIVSSGNSSLFVNHCQFVNNRGINGSCFHIQENSGLKIENSVFSNNTGVHSGGVVLVRSKSIVSVKLSRFENNSVWYTKIANISNVDAHIYYPGGGVLKAEDGVHVKIDSCVFVDNSCQLFTHNSRGAECSGGVIKVEYWSLLMVTNSTFVRNYADYGTTLAVFEHSNVTILDCIFKENHGAITMIGAQTVRFHLALCSFLLNVAHIPTGISDDWLLYSWGNSSLSVANCSFGRTIKQAVFVLSESSLDLQWCHFSSIKQVIDADRNGSVTAANCTFENNTHVFYARGVNIIVKECVFSTNQEIVNVRRRGTLRIAKSTFQDNGPENAVQCVGCSWVSVDSCLFLENYMLIRNAFFAAFPGNVNLPVGIIKHQAFSMESHSLFDRTNNSAHLGQCGSHNNTNDSISAAHEPRIELMRCKFSSNNGWLVSSAHGSVFAVNCTFENNTHVIRVQAVHIFVERCIFSTNREIIQVEEQGTVVVAKSKFIQNRPGSIVCDRCTTICVSFCTFLENKHRAGAIFTLQDLPLALDKTGYVVTLTNCTFNNAGTVMSSYSKHIITCAFCNFTFDDAHNNNIINIFVEIFGSSKLFFVGSFIFLSPQLLVKVRLQFGGGVTFSETVIHGCMLFVVRGNSQLHFHNSRIISVLHGSFEDPYMSMDLITMSDSSKVVMRDTYVSWSTSTLIGCIGGTVILSNCNFFLQASVPAPAFFSGINSSFLISNTCFGLDINQAFEDNNTSYFALYSHTTAFFEFSYSNISMFHVTATQTSLGATIPQNYFMFLKSNVNLDKCFLTSISLLYGGLSSSKLTITESEVFNRTSLLILGQPEFIMMKNSTVRSHIIPCCKPYTSDCNAPLTTLRLAETNMSTQSPIPPIGKLFTWNSLIWMGEDPLETGDENFIQISRTKGLFNFSQCKQDSALSQNQTQDVPVHSETKYTAG